MRPYKSMLVMCWSWVMLGMPYFRARRNSSEYGANLAGRPPMIASASPNPKRAALLDDDERDFQRQVLSGPPPLGPGAQPLDRLTAYGQARIDFLIGHLSSAALSQTPARVADRLGRGWSDLVRRVTREA